MNNKNGNVPIGYSVSFDILAYKFRWNNLC